MVGSRLVIDRVEKLGSKVRVRKRMREIIDNLAYARKQGMDKPEITNWQWTL